MEIHTRRRQVTGYGGLSRQQRQLLVELCGASSDDRVMTIAEGITVTDAWHEAASKLAERGLVEPQTHSAPSTCWLTTLGWALCHDLSLHDAYNQQAKPGWRY
ncbi:hypothetical protein LAG73_07405 [Pseudoxanthomonas japonensis]|nr:hypothetical protein LAG73_07405 [Pseudoxanthomonas japonensis]